MNSLAKYTHLLNRFPKFELSYETVSHKKVSNQDTIGIAISLGRKYFIWHTYKSGGSDPACYLIGLDKDKQICSVEPCLLQTNTPDKYKLGTIVYGTLYENQNQKNVAESDAPHIKQIFIAEDIYYHCGVNLSNLCFGDRIGFLREFIIATIPERGFAGYRIENASSIQHIALPIMWSVEAGKEQSPIIPSQLETQMAYTAHHIQYREIHRVAPYINVAIPKKGAIPTTVSVPISSAKVAQKISATSVMNPVPLFDFTKPAYRYPAVFNITADPQLDLYHLYAYGGCGGGGGGTRNGAVYCGLACVQSLKTSVFMNGLFRRIRENSNLDLAEESEDDADFEDTNTHKYVNLDAILQVECAFNTKHRKWTPICLAKKEERIIHIEKLVGYSSNSLQFAGQRRNIHSNPTPRRFDEGKHQKNMRDKYSKL